MTTLLAHLERIKHLLPSVSEMQVSKMQGGFSNDVFCLGWKNKPRLVLRVPALDEVVFGIHRFSEKRALLEAESLSISPPVLLYDESGLCVSRYVPQSSFSWDVRHSDAEIRRLGQSLKQIHTMQDNGTEYRLHDVIEGYIEKALHHPSMTLVLSKRCLDLKKMAVNYAKKIPEYVPKLCHNDINPKNCLVDALHFWVIDWEYSGMGDPLFDLAVVCVSHNLSDEQQQILITEYDEKLPLKSTQSILKNYHILYLIREMAWLLLKHLHTPHDIESLQCFWAFDVTLIEALESFDDEL